MSGKEYTTELLKLEDAQIERMEETEEEIILQISLKRKMHNCPRCKAETDQVHDYRIRAKMYPRKWTDERVQNPDMKTIRVHRIPFCGQVRAKTLNSGQIGCEKLDSAETDVYNCIIKEG